MSKDTPVKVKDSKDWVTAFDRDLIKAAQMKTKTAIVTIDEEYEMRDLIILQVDQNFIKVQNTHQEVWLNKANICKVMIGRATL